MSDFNSQIVQISQDTLDKLFSDTPESTVTGEDLGLIEKPKPEGKEKPDDKKEPTPTPQPSNEIVEIDLDTIDDQEEEDEVDDDSKKEPTKDKKKEKEPAEPTSDITDAEKEVLKKTVDYLVSSGQWKDFEGREDLEIDDEKFGQLVLAQDRARVEEMFSELVDSTGDYGKAIISHIKNGGNPDEIIDLFKEQKYIESIDTSSIEGKILKIESYYTDIVGWKPAKVEKYLKTLAEKGEDELEAEFADVDEKYEEYYQERIQEIQQQQAERERVEKQKQEKFVSDLKATISKREDLTDKDKKFVESSLLKFKNKLPDGRVVNDFFLKFVEMQQDPEAYTDLVLFVMDRQRFKKNVEDVKTKSKEAKETFSFIKGNGAVKKNISSTTGKKDDSYKSTDFSVIFKK